MRVTKESVRDSDKESPEVNVYCLPTSRFASLDGKLFDIELVTSSVE